MQQEYVSQYDSYSKWKGWALSFSFSEGDRRYYEREFGEIVLPGRRVVEMGFGNGGLLAWAKDKGAEVYGIEIQPEILSAAAQHGYTAVSTIDQLSPYRGDGFDAVVALDVFEHIPPDVIASVLVSVDSILKPGGLLILRAPNGVSPFGRLHQHSDATHMSVISPKKIVQYAQGTHLSLHAVRNEARIPHGPTPIHRFAKRVQFALRECISRMIASIYALPFSTLDANIVIILRKEVASRQ